MDMTLALSDFIRLQEPEQYKLHLAVSNSVDEPLDVFVRDAAEWLSWNTWRNDRDDFSRRYIFSLIRFYPQADRWLFGGLFEVVERKLGAPYKLSSIREYEKLVGRLLIFYPSPGVRGRAFNLENHYSKLVVDQIFQTPYSGEAFPGYENVNHTFKLLEPLFRRNAHDWKAALQSVKGVYLVSDASNGRMYVGSAYGGDGIWSRWEAYVGTGHGSTDELTKLISEKSIDYARANFTFSILEYQSMMTDDQVIIDREQYWKRVLLSRKFGYNRN